MFLLYSSYDVVVVFHLSSDHESVPDLFHPTNQDSPSNTVHSASPIRLRDAVEYLETKGTAKSLS